MTQNRLRVAVAAVLGSLALLGLGVANGAVTSKAKVHNKINIKSIEPDGVSGVVTSPEDGCEEGRKVKLYYSPQAPPRGGAPQEQLLGSDKTNGKGKWSLDGSFFVGHYHAVVEAKSVKGKLDEEVREAAEDDEEDESAKRRDKCSYTSTTTDE
jgi:hypothetical protein